MDRRLYQNMSVWYAQIAVVQAVILYRSETWVMYPRMWKPLGGLNHWVV